MQCPSPLTASKVLFSMPQLDPVPSSHRSFVVVVVETAADACAWTVSFGVVVYAPPYLRSVGRSLK